MLTSQLLSPNSGVVEAALRAHRETIAKAASNQEGYKPSLGQEAFSLEAPAALLQPFTFPLVSKIKRVPMPENNSSVTHYKQITSARPNGLATVSVEDGAKGPTIIKTSADRQQTIRRISLSDFVVDDAQVFARDYDNLMALADLIALNMLQEAEDRLDIGGQNTAALANPAAPTVANSAGGSMTAGNVNTYKIVALTTQGVYQARQASYDGFDIALVPLNINGSTAAGAGTAGAATALNDKQTVTWTHVPDAVAYDVYAAIGAGADKWQATVYTNRHVQLTDPATTTATAPATNNSQDLNAYDGLVQQLRSAGAPQTSLDNAALTGTTASKNIEEWLEQFENVFRSTQTGPTDIYVGPEISRGLPDKIGGSSATVINLTATGNDMSFKGGLKVDSVLNPLTGETVEIHTHANIPNGLILGLRFPSPYTHARLSGESIDMVTAKDYWRETFAKTLYRVDFGVASMQALRVRSALGSFVQCNVAP